MLTKVVPSSSFQRQGMIVDSTNIEPGSSMEVPEQSPTFELVEVKLPATWVLPTPVSSSSSKRLDYSGDDDVDRDNVYSAPDTSKYSHLAEEEISVEETPASTSGVTERSSHFEDLPSPTLWIGKYLNLSWYSRLFSIIINIVQLIWLQKILYHFKQRSQS